MPSELLLPRKSREKGKQNELLKKTILSQNILKQLLGEYINFCYIK